MLDIEAPDSTTTAAPAAAVARDVIGSIILLDGSSMRVVDVALLSTFSAFPSIFYYHGQTAGGCIGMHKAESIQAS